MSQDPSMYRKNGGQSKQDRKDKWDKQNQNKDDQNKPDQDKARAKKLDKQSHALTWVLRHGCPAINSDKLGFGKNPPRDGFLRIVDILELSSKRGEINVLNGLTLPDLEFIVATDKKTRFALRKCDDGDSINSYKIRANQGHSYSVPDLEVYPVNPDEIPYAFHGTTSEAYALIKASGYISKMGRDDIHFTEEKDFNNLGRKNSQVVLKVDIKRATDVGIKFVKSANGVVLSKGINGNIPFEYLSLHQH
jgi:2'-phosphotransferase